MLKTHQESPNIINQQQQQMPAPGMHPTLTPMQQLQLQQQIELAKLLPYFNYMQANANANNVVNNRVQLPPHILSQLTPEQLSLYNQQQQEQQMIERLNIQQIQQILSISLI